MDVCPGFNAGLLWIFLLRPGTEDQSYHNEENAHAGSNASPPITRSRKQGLCFVFLPPASMLDEAEYHE